LGCEWLEDALQVVKGKGLARGVSVREASNKDGKDARVVS
jgi:hypothetical protein